jgi:hypothetical protein
MTVLKRVGGVGWREFGDGGDEAVGFVEDELFDQDAVFDGGFCTGRGG